MSKRARQALLLAVLVAVLVFVGWRQLAPLTGDAGGSRLTSGTDRASSGAARKAGASEDLPEVIALRVSDLDPSAGEYSPGRDPFRFAQAKPPPPPKPKRDDEAARRALREAQAEREREKAAAKAPPKPKPPPVDVVYLGSFGPDDRRLAVFSDGSDIFNVLEGGVLKKSFIVVRIGYESADLGFVGFPDAPAERLEIGG